MASNSWTADFFNAAVAMDDWPQFVHAVRAARETIWLAAREALADSLIASLDMTPEGYVREWDARGRGNVVPLLAWEHAYQRAGMIEAAERRGYIRIGSAVSCPISLEAKGERLLAAKA